MHPGKPRGYAFIEFEHKNDMKSAYKMADGRKVENKRVTVDVERGRTVPNWFASLCPLPAALALLFATPSTLALLYIACHTSAWSSAARPCVCTEKAF